MKKFFSLLLALATIGSASASVILHESFDREVGTLNKGVSDASTNNRTDWYSFSGSSKYIQVAEGSLSYAGYASKGTGNKVQLTNGSAADDLRQFNAITSGKVYAAAIISVATLKVTTSSDYFLTFGNASNSSMGGRLHVKGIANDAEEYASFQLGVSKWGDAAQFAETKFALNDTILVVLEYEIVDGDKNDIARLYINPTSATTDPSATCDATKAGSQNDLTMVASINLRQGSNTPASVFVDEIKVATEWADLFESGADDNKPAITVSDVLTFETELGGYFVGDTYTGTLIVSGQYLTEDITLSSSTDEITFSQTTITKEAAEAEGGVTITATLVPNAATDYEGKDATITLTSGEATATVNAHFTAFPLTRCKDIAALKAAGAAGEGYDVNARFTGNAVVTYIQQNPITYTIEDATGAVNIITEYTWYDKNIELGDELTNILVMNDEMSFGIQPFWAVDASVQIVSKNKEIEPQEVTLAELQANPADYLLELVRVKNVAFDETDVLFSAGSFPITQGEASASVNILAGNTLIGEAKPAKADVTGISSAANGKVIRPRGKEDVVVHTATGIEAATFDAETEIYTIQGMRVESLQPGVNIIRKGNTVYKVVR